MAGEGALRVVPGDRRAHRVGAPLGFGAVLVVLMAWQTAHPLDIVVNLQVATVLVLSSLLGWVLLHRRGHRVEPSRGVVILLAGFCLSAAGSVSLSAFPAVALVRFGLYVGLALAAVALYLAYRREASLPLSWWLVVVASVHVPFSVHAVVELARWGESISPYLGVFWNVRHLGTAGMLAAMAAVGLVVLDPRRRALAAVLATFGVFDIVATGSRGAFLSWLCTVVILLLLTRPRRVVAAVSAVAAGVAFAAVALLDRAGILVTRNLLERFDQGASEGMDAFTSGRLEVWSTSMEQIGAHPLFGAGPDAYWLSECCVTTVPHAHNVVLQALMEFGLVGCGLLLVTVVWATVPVGARSLLVAVTATRQNAVLVAMTVGIVALSMIDGAFYWTFPLVHLAACVGLLAAGVSQARRRWMPECPDPDHSSRPSENAASRSWEE